LEPRLESLLDKRVVLVTGKGGVGRSSVTAALGHLAIRRGLRALVTEVGDAPEDDSPLARYFGRSRFPATPVELEPGLRGVLLLARTGQELFVKQVLHSAAVARAALGSEAVRRLLSAGPSFKEMGVFFQLLTLLKAKTRDGQPEHQLILVDMPATGHTLSLTGLPDYLLKLVPTGPIAEALREGQGYLNDPEKAACWIVTLPETLPVSECLELASGLARTRMPTGGILVNRMPGDPYTPEERALLTPLLAQRPVLGGESFQRPLLARREMSRLLAATDLPVYALPELPHERLVQALAGELAVVQPVDRRFGAGLDRRVSGRLGLDGHPAPARPEGSGS
jgi:Mrp family chromosome partitioning ATPase